jgi:hypothetical protein
MFAEKNSSLTNQKRSIAVRKTVVLRYALCNSLIINGAGEGKWFSAVFGGTAW